VRGEKMPRMAPAPTSHPTRVPMKAATRARARVREQGQVQVSAAAAPLRTPAAAVVEAAKAAVHHRPSRHRASGRQRHRRRPRRRPLFRHQAQVPTINTSCGRPLRATCPAPVRTTGRGVAPTTAVCARSPLAARADASSAPRWYLEVPWRALARRPQLPPDR